MSVLFITHNVFESVFLSTKVVVMTPRTGKISDFINIPFAYPRDDEFRTRPEFGEYVRSVSAVLKH
ncbi:ABC-type nitrate/sulfonate/bicarbonate transport system ATPase subunit [Paenibacillus brasilensis]|uniref:ABC-type nitrate/sulfonate/bicarbonate transport system ATPase subunit n=1 Tax=Paenibacillus brasilensis TaxID=128574 RepID=A0ABU0L2N4_9BACL|nr:ABC-type nitrate/sulfonate/bicarbonate transport system ATPase subunit [Paenibacillus brasilensis]